MICDDLKLHFIASRNTASLSRRQGTKTMRIATVATQLFLLVMLTRVSGVAAGDETHTIVLTVTEPTGDARRGWPVTSGVPFGQGVLWDGDSTALFAANGDQLPLQTEVLSRWADGSVRWLLLDFAVDLRPHEKQLLTLRHGSSVRRAPVADGVRVVSSEDSVVLRTGPMQSILSLKHFRLLDDVRLDRNQDGEFSEDERVTSSSNAGIMLRTPDGETFTADQATAQATVEQDGPLRACVRWEGQHASHQGTMFRYVLRIHAFRGQPFLKMHYTFINDYQSELMAKIDSLALTFSLRDAEQVTYVTDGKLSSGGRLFQLDDRSYAIDGRSAGQRAHGWIAQGNATTGMAVGLREFWQNWPKGLQQNPGMLQVEICPDFPSGQYDEKPLEEECQLYYYLRGGVYSFKIGVARTHELWATFFPGAPDVARLTEFFEATEKPLLAQCAPEYIGTTEAMGRFPPADPGRFGGYDHWMNLFFDQHLADRGRFREYGMLNNGDWYNTNWDSWGNLEYDTSRIWFLQYLRTGDRRYFDRAEQAVQHYIDVDIVHAVNPMVQAYPGSINMQPGQIWAHSVGHTGGYYARYVNEKYEDEAPLRQKGAPQVGFWDHGHVWIGGVFDAYLLTGDRRAREVGVLASDAMSSLCPTLYTDHIRWVGWPLHLELAAYEATGDKKYLDAAHKQWRVLKDNFDSQTGWVVMLAFGHCSVEAESGRCRGNNMYMLGFTLTALARYHRITGDPELLKALSTGLDQVIRETWSEQDKSFYLTSCRHAQKSPAPAYSSVTFHVSEALAYESRLTGNKEHRRILRESLRHGIDAGMKILQSQEALGQTGYYSGVFLFPAFALSELNDD
ncbi:MAG: hypothetical protein NT069_24675 [Planctomycetota bacterium]|nr:hypothetical protein [Planctomycetota bacterium]